MQEEGRKGWRRGEGEGTARGKRSVTADKWLSEEPHPTARLGRGGGNNNNNNNKIKFKKKKGGER